jgi:AraC-like DNA-binding protein
MGFHGLHRYQPGAPMPRHRHAEPYMAIVVDGGYLEAGDSGRIEASPGDVLIHGAYDAHQDAFLPGGAIVLNLPLDSSFQSGFGRIDDVDAIVRLAERDARQASIQARAALAWCDVPLSDWPDLLAAALRDDPDLAISSWADDMGLSPASVSRGFARAYGVSPKRFRLEARVRNAARRLSYWRGNLAALAAYTGFADQAHMTRAIAAMTGQTPARLRAKSVQAEGSPVR